MNSLNLKEARGSVETSKHINCVQKNISIFIKELVDRSLQHDLSKLESPEVEIFGEYTPELEKTEYGSEKYKELLDKVKPAIDNHYAKNRHHPEHHKNGVNDMDLVDLIELLSDWYAATLRNKNGNIRKSLEINSKRYDLSPQLVKILENTVEKYF
jgi:hypothetical protein